MKLSTCSFTWWAHLALFTACEEKGPAHVDSPSGDAAHLPADAMLSCGCVTREHVWVLVEEAGSEGGNDPQWGPEICGLEVVCGAQAHHAVEAQIRIGEGDLCDAVREDCPTSRVDPQAALGPIEDICDAGSVPSDYVVLGLGGSLAVRFEGLEPCGLAGCRVRVSELEGVWLDGYVVRVCADPSGLDCLPTSGSGAEPLVGPRVVECCTCAQ